jgi:hypothetical protein
MSAHDDYREIHERADDVNDDEYFERDNEEPPTSEEDAALTLLSS